MREYCENKNSCHTPPLNGFKIVRYTGKSPKLTYNFCININLPPAIEWINSRKIFPLLPCQTLGLISSLVPNLEVKICKCIVTVMVEKMAPNTPNLRAQRTELLRFPLDTDLKDYALKRADK